MKILSRNQIEKALLIPKILDAIEQGFIAYSKKETVISPVTSLSFNSPPGECHIKCGYEKNGRYYVVKVASGFYENPKKGFPSTNGLIVLFDKLTGNPVSILLDEGLLTNIRTAAAGCIAAKLLAPKNIQCIGIVGTGEQAFYQLKLLAYMTNCRQVMIWGRDIKKAQMLSTHIDLKDWMFEFADDIGQVTKNCNLIVTTTSSADPLLFAHQIKPGTHITAVGADDFGKQELDEEIFVKADKVVVDSKSQCAEFGDTSHALRKNLIHLDKLVELGEIIENPFLGRTSENEITLCDLTGIAIQDLLIAESILISSQTQL